MLPVTIVGGIVSPTLEGAAVLGARVGTEEDVGDVEEVGEVEDVGDVEMVGASGVVGA